MIYRDIKSLQIYDRNKENSKMKYNLFIFILFIFCHCIQSQQDECKQNLRYREIDSAGVCPPAFMLASDSKRDDSFSFYFSYECIKALKLEKQCRQKSADLPGGIRW